jgi:hypothetical protein
MLSKSPTNPCLQQGNGCLAFIMLFFQQHLFFDGIAIYRSKKSLQVYQWIFLSFEYCWW